MLIRIFPDGIKVSHIPMIDQVIQVVQQRRMKYILGLLALLPVVTPECPDINSIPVMDRSYRRFNCALIYFKVVGDNDPIQACNGTPGLWASSHNATAPSGYWYFLGSIIVLPGCTLYGFKDRNYRGTVEDYIGPGLWPNEGGY